MAGNSAFGNITVGATAKLITAKGYKITQDDMFKWLRTNGYLQSGPGAGYNTPHKKYIDMGLFEVKEAKVCVGSFYKKVYTTLVTPKGKRYFIKAFMEKLSA